MRQICPCYCDEYVNILILEKHFCKWFIQILYIYIYIYIYSKWTYVYIYTYIMSVLVVSKSLRGYVSNQVQYNIESA